MRNALKEALHDDEDESIVRVESSTSDGIFDVQFAQGMGGPRLLDSSRRERKACLVARSKWSFCYVK